MTRTGVRKPSVKPRKWTITIDFESKKLKLTTVWVRRTLQEILAHAERDIAVPGVNEINVLFTDDKRIRVINREFRKKDKATDVLSFPQYTPREISGRGRIRELVVSPSLGDLVISTETTIRQAKAFEVTQKDEVIRLLVHGVLHLCGYDHEKVPPAEAQRMRRRDRYIRARL